MICVKNLTVLPRKCLFFGPQQLVLDVLRINP
jgi:hypothetical protein